MIKLIQEDHPTAFSDAKQDNFSNIGDTEAVQELALRDQACESFRQTVSLILNRALVKNDLKTALKAQELLARHFGLLPSASRYRKVRFMGKMYTESEFQEMVSDIHNYLQQEIGLNVNLAD